MPQSTTFPIRYGLTVPRGENLQATEVLCEGGLDLTQEILEIKPGYASVLTNFEPSLIGGYRRISGFAKYSSTIVPGQGKLLGVAVYTPGAILAARQDGSDATKYNIYTGTGTSWTQLNPSTTTAAGTTHTSILMDGMASTTGLIPGQPVSGSGIVAGTRIANIIGPNSLNLTIAASSSTTATFTFSNPLSFTSGMVLSNHYYNWTGTSRIIFTDGVNPAYRWDGTTFTIIFASGSAANPKFVTEHMHYLFVSGYSSNFGAIKFSSPLIETDWNTVDGAGETVVGDTVTWIQPWRQSLIIFCRNSIYRLIGDSSDVNSSTPFTLRQITDKIGCLEGRTVQEIDGNLVFLAQDGLRTISGTIKIGDTETGSISRPIQPIVNAINPVTTPCHSLVVGRKTQYRLFYPDPNSADISCKGVLMGIRRFRDGHEAWEPSQLQGIKPACCANGYFADDNEYIIHGGFDGFVYRQEQGATFNGAAINEVYTTVPLELGDRTLRKVIHRITLLVSVDTGSSPTLSMSLLYDLDSTTTVQPSPYLMPKIGGMSINWDDATAIYDATGIVYDLTGAPYIRQNVQGSGFLVQLQFNSTTNLGYTIQGFTIEYFPAARR